MEMITFLLGFCIGAVTILDIFLIMAYRDLRKGAKE